MKRQLQRFLYGAMIVMATNAFADDCLTCPNKVVAGMPGNASLEGLEKILKGGVTTTEDIYTIKIFCMKFGQIPQEFVGTTIKEMEKTHISIETYFTQPLCQPRGYSDVVQSPIIHVIADDPTKRVEFLQNIWLYYSKKRKEPEIFDQIINAKNTKGQTLLDYLESMRERGFYKDPAQKLALIKIINMLCSHSGVYATYKEMKCPTI